MASEVHPARAVGASGSRSADCSPVLTSRLAGSRAPDHTERFDPLHELTYLAATRTTWSQISTVAQVLSLRNGAVVHTARKRYSPIEAPHARLYSPAALQTVALLAQFHQLSTAQIAAFTGAALGPTWPVVSALYAAGVLQRSVPQWWDPADVRPAGGTGNLWQLNLEHGEAIGVWLDRLEDVEHMMLTCGRDITAGTSGARSASSTRHNLVMAEIALRAVECCPGVLGAWGEAASVASLLSEDPGMRANIADGTIVARDGSLVVIETSGRSQLDSDKSGQTLAAKAASWAAVAARSPVPMKVIFVNIAASARRRRFDWHVMRGVQDASSYLSRALDLERAHAAVFTADAYDWFPMANVVSRGFQALEAFNPTTKRFAEVITRCPAVERTDAVVNTLASLHTPTWVASPLAALTAA